MNEITYIRLSGGATAVLLDGRRTGTIATLPGKGFQYRAGTHRGQIFKTIDEVKKSIESEE